MNGFNSKLDLSDILFQFARDKTTENKLQNKLTNSIYENSAK